MFAPFIRLSAVSCGRFVVKGLVATSPLFVTTFSHKSFPEADLTTPASLNTYLTSHPFILSVFNGITNKLTDTTNSFAKKMEEKSANAQSLPQPIVINGPSGVGKGTLITKLLKDYPNDFGFSVSHTTRQARPGEVDGVHYHFVTDDVIKKLIAENGFVEYAHVHTNTYGTSKVAVEKVMKEGKICILDIDVQGAEQVKKSSIHAKYIFVAPPSYEELEKRLRGRNTETETSIQKRLTNAKKELDYLNKPGFYDYVIVNDDLEVAYQDLKDYIFHGIKKDHSISKNSAL